MILHIDFETRSEIDLGKCGAWTYSMHPSTEVLCLAYARSEGDVVIVPREKLVLGLKDALFQGGHPDKIVAHNAFFEMCIWKNILVKKMGYPEIQDDQWLCTAAMASVMGLPKALKDIPQALGLDTQKDMEGRKIMLKMCKPRKVSKTDTALWHETEKDFAKLQKYCAQDVETERYIHKNILKLSDKEIEVFLLDTKINFKGAWKNIMVKKRGYTDTADKKSLYMGAMDYVMGLPKGRKHTPEGLGLETDKGMEVAKIILKMCKPRRAAKANPVTWHETEEDFAKLQRYCIQDVETERQIHTNLLKLSDKELAVWRLDTKINFRGIPIDLGLADSAIKLIAENKELLTLEVTSLTSGQVGSVTQSAKLLQWLKETGLSNMTDVKKASVVEALKTGGLPDNTRRVLEIRQEASRTSTAKYQALKNAAPDGRLRGSLAYHSAFTGRWGGRLFQPHNLPRGNLKDMDLACETIKTGDLEWIETCYPSLMSVLSGAVRGALCAGGKRKLLVVDYSSIEARVICWLAGQNDILDLYRKGEDLYVNMAQKIYGKQDISKEERSVGKVAILGASYGMGASKFKDTCSGYGIEIEESMAKKVIDAYRKEYSKVCKFWWLMEKNAKDASQNVDHRGKVSWIKDGHISVLPSGRVVTYMHPVINCVLPSGRVLGYRHPEVKEGSLTYMGLNSTTKKYSKQSTYGGRLAENITQAVARDIMAEAMLRLDKAGYPIILTVHDEIICEVLEDGDKTLEEMITIMTEVPDWAEGLPLEASGWEGKRYKK